jgi:hypothetical protein
MPAILVPFIMPGITSLELAQYLRVASYAIQAFEYVLRHPIGFVVRISCYLAI